MRQRRGLRGRPDGFTTNLRPSGEWRYVMRGPDGTDYANHSMFTAIDTPNQLAFDHFGPMHAFQVRVTFYDFSSGTLRRWGMRFRTAAACAAVFEFIAPANDSNSILCRQCWLRRRPPERLDV